MQNETPFLDLFIFPDTTFLQTSKAEDPNLIGSINSGNSLKESNTDDLESKFSVPKEGSTITPEEGAHEVYCRMQHDFANFLAQQ